MITTANANDKSAISERAKEYMRKTFRIALYGLSSNKVFIVLMFMVSMITFILTMNAWNYSMGEQVGFIAISGLLGVFMPVVMFQHMLKRREYDFYTAMPVKKSCYFWGFGLAAFMSFLMIWLFLFSVTVMLGFTEAIRYFLPGFMLYFTVSSATVLALVLSKSVFSFIMIFLILNFLALELFGGFLSIFNVDSRVYMIAFEKTLSFFTPFYSAQLFFQYDRDWLLLGLLPVVMGGIQLAAAFLLHRRRSGEGQDTLAFSKTRCPIQYIIMFMAALTPALLSLDTFYYRREKNFGDFVSATVKEGHFVGITLVVIFGTFVITNMIFENTPRGVFKKVRHLFIFTAGYWIFYFFILGAILFPNIPLTYVPFNGNMAIVSVYGFEEKTEAEYNEMMSVYNNALFEHNNYNGESGEEYSRLYNLYNKASEEEHRWKNVYEDETAKYFYRKANVASYIVTDSEYLKNISDRLAEMSKNFKGNFYQYWDFGYPNIISDARVSPDRENAYSYIDEKYYYENALIFEIALYELTDWQYDEFTEKYGKDEFYVSGDMIFNNRHRYSFRTYVDSPEALKEFSEHTAYKSSENAKILLY